MKINDLYDFSVYKPTLYRFFLYFWFFGFFTLMIGTGCTTLDLNKAFNGEFNGVKNNKLINTYCTSCHNHKEFDSELHLDQIRPKYKRRLFRLTSECRTCHYIKKTWADDHTFRKTRGYKKANRGGFKKFEKNY
jgi:hypothetical protein